MLAVTGYHTSIVESIRLKMKGEKIDRIEACPDLSYFDCTFGIPYCDKYLLCAGVLHGQEVLRLSGGEIKECLAVNMVNVIRLCETILDMVPNARICVIGSESAYLGSFDKLYAASKAAVHSYVETRKHSKDQQLVSISPCIISDSGMTKRRKDYPEVITKRKTVTSMEVANWAIDLLYSKEIEFTNTIIRMEGR